MSLPSTFLMLVQATAAVLIFTICYLALLISVITCLGIGALGHRGVRLLWTYMMRRAASSHRVPTEVSGTVRLARINH